MIVLNDIQRNLAEAIKQSGMKQTAIAKKLGISQQTISHYIKGDKMPALDTFANLCVIIDVDPADILCTNDSGAKEKAVRVSDSFNNNSGSINFKV